MSGPNSSGFSAGHADASLANTVSRIVREQKVTDLHTHLYAPGFGSLLLWGFDELMTYHYLVAEAARTADFPLDTFWSLTKREQADLIWKRLFLEHTPLSEACRGVLTCLKAYGFDLDTRDADTYRSFFAGRDSVTQVETVLDLAGVDQLVMTNDPFDDEERKVWLSGIKPDARFHAALRIDPLLHRYEDSSRRLSQWGYQVSEELDGRSVDEIRRFLKDWIGRMNPVYMAVSMPDTFTYPDDSPGGRILRDAVLPECAEAKIPLALMIGVSRGVNPALRDAGDASGRADMQGVARLIAEHRNNRFLITVLSRENQHELAVLARKFPNLMVFGCWWFMNNPSLIRETTRMRMEMLGTSFIPQHSDARVLDQLLYKWSHSREIVAAVLTEKYADIIRTGWRVDEADIRKDAADLLHNNFWRFVGRPENIETGE